MNTSQTINQPADAATIDSVGQNIALIFQAAKATGQSEAVVREALQALQTLAGYVNLHAAAASDPV